MTRLEPPELIHQFPQFLPDGRHFLYYSTHLVFVSQLDSSERRRLLEADTAAVYVSTGHLIFARQGTPFAQAFDPVRLVLTGNPFRVAEHVASAVSTSATGTLVFRAGSARAPSSTRALVWFDRSGKEIRKVNASDLGIRPSLSPSGRQVALMGGPIAGPPEIWLLTLDRDRLSRFTQNRAINLDPVWSPDGSRIVFSKSNPKGLFDLYWKPTIADREEELVLSTPPDKIASTASDWSRDGEFVLYNITTVAGAGLTNAFDVSPSSIRVILNWKPQR